MDSEEEFMHFSDPEMQPSPFPVRELKRLRKATHNIPKDPSSDGVEPSSSHDVNSDSSILDVSDRAETNSEEDPNACQFEGFKDGIELFDGVDIAEENKSGANEVEVQNEELRADLGLDLEKPSNLDGYEENGDIKKKKKRVERNSDGFDENLPTAAATKQMREKERRERFRDLRSESQRLLRDTRDAAFKPVPLAQMSVSSVLEKIRKRKHELSKKNSLIGDNGITSSEFTLDFDIEDSPLENIEIKVAEANNEETKVCCADVEGSLGTKSVHETPENENCCHKNATPKMVPTEDLKQIFRAPVDDTQDLLFDSQTSDTQLSDELPNSSPEDVMEPSLLAMNLRLDSAPPDDYSSDEEENDKENIDPDIQGSVDLPSSPKDDPVKAFVDDEAEEEDDSDNDLARFKDKEEEEDIMDSEELNDIIASGYEEKPMDSELRNQLHQKWLEQQDAAGTENLLQRLKCSTKQREMALIEEEEDEESEEAEDEFPDDPAEHVIPKKVLRMNLKKAKEMICRMFTDKDDVYVSSDDEETEVRLVKQQLSDKTEEQAKFLSPAEDESSKDLFGLIKKLNAVPETRRRAKITSHFHTRSIGVNKTTSKSSFLSRRSKNLLPSIQKHGPGTVRSFVFERDDSSSRNAITTLEDSSEAVQRDNRPKKTASAKYSSPQVRSSSQNTPTVAENNSGPSLHEILRCQSLQSSHSRQGGMASHVEAIYASFKLDQNLVKKERGVSIRTA